ncbi:glycosyltransferase [Thioalkalicoccus limnaeus]|uniref:Glycosyltransferase n=1 Tax=Thioalkalicoccus limnaeus TaxID=120681 RepID=A0ABV4BDV0_9GAMM
MTERNLSLQNSSPLLAPLVDPRVEAGLAWCRRHRGDEPLTLALPFEVPEPQLVELLSRPGIESLIIDQAPSAAFLARHPDRVGRFCRADYSWRLPPRLGRWILFVGGRENITARMLRESFRRRVRRLAYWRLDRWAAQWLAMMAIAKVVGKLHQHTQRFRAARRMNRQEPGTDPRSLMEFVDRRGFRRLLQTADLRRISPDGAVPGRVVIACPTLAAGGAERQIVNTALGLQQVGLRDLTVLVANLRGHPGNDFFLGALKDAGIPVQEVGGPAMSVESWVRAQDPEITALTVRVGAALQDLPPGLAQEVANLYLTFVDQRPAIVHAWLDHSSVSAGLAALLAGVPRVLLSGRNVSPVHFPYIFQSYMQPAYQAMAERPEVVWVNNSRGGGADYAVWLGLAPDRFEVVYNGVDLTATTRASMAAIADWRSAHGIPDGARLVGGMFRLSDEKRPLLWIETLARLADRHGDVQGLLFGAGPLQATIAARIEALGLAGRVHLRPPTSAHALALSSFDLLLLTSRWEGTPNVAIEAQAVSTPVVVCGGGGAGEALLDGVTGLFVVEADAERLADAVSGLLTDDAQRARFAAAGPAFVRERFGLERMIDQTLAIYDLPAR